MTTSNPRPPTGFTVRSLERADEADEMNRVYVRCGMVPAPVEVLWDNSEQCDALDYLVAVRDDDGSLVGTVTGVDHKRLFDDPENGSSLWTLAVDPTTSLPGVGAALTRILAALYRERGRAYMDLSVAHDNGAAIGLYEKLGFERVPVMAVKRKNAINEPLFTHPPETVDDLNPYARIIADEAMRRGIWVEVLDAEAGEMRLSHGGRSVITRESLSEYTSAVAMARCDDKRLTRRIVSEAGIQVPRGRLATFDEHDHAFLDEVGDVVVKPTRGEQGKGITVGVDGGAELDAALARAREEHPAVLIEQRAPGDDLRLVVIDGKVVAAALRKPAEIVGTGHHTVRELIEAQSRRRSAATGGESRIPIDDVTEATVAEAGFSFDDVLPEGQAPSCAQDGEPPSGRHHPRCDCEREPATVRGRGDGRRRHRYPGDGHRPVGSRRHRAGLRIHRGQRTARTGQPRAAAHRKGFRRLPIPGKSRAAAGVDPRRGAVGLDLPGAGAHHDLGCELRRGLLRVSPSQQIDHPVVAVHVALACFGDGARGCRTDQGGGVHLHRRTIAVADHPGEIGDARVAAVDDHQPDEPVQPSRGKLPRQFAADAITDQQRPFHFERIEDADHRLGGQPRVRGDDHRSQ